MITHKSNKHVLDGMLMNLYLETLKQNPKPEDRSESMHLLCLTIEILEKLGNPFPAQEEIDNLESMLKRFKRRKIIKADFKKSFEELPYAA